MSLMRDEILEQPGVLAELFEGETEAVCRLAAELRRADPRFVVIAARGSSDNAARYAQYAFGSLLGLQVALATPSLYTLYGQPPDLRQALVIGISQSGQSEDIVAVLAEARRQGVPTLAITNSPDSPLAAQASHLIQTHAGVERAVAATKTYTSQLAALGLLVACWRDDPALLEQLRAVPQAMRAAQALEPTLHQAAARYREALHGVVLGRGYLYGTAFEIALKIKEVSYLAIEPYSPADFLHGPVALIEAGFPAVVLAPSGRAFENLHAFAVELRARGASLVMVSERPQALELADVPLRLPEIPAEWVSPMIAVVPGQLLAVHMAEARGHDPDKPRGLKKVTVTR